MVSPLKYPDNNVRSETPIGAKATKVEAEDLYDLLSEVGLYRFAITDFSTKEYDIESMFRDLLGWTDIPAEKVEAQIEGSIIRIREIGEGRVLSEAELDLRNIYLQELRVLYRMASTIFSTLKSHYTLYRHMPRYLDREREKLVRKAVKCASMLMEMIWKIYLSMSYPAE